MHHRRTVLLLVLFTLGISEPAWAQLRALIIDGQNNHAMWPMTTAMMKQYLEETGMFQVDVARTRYTWQGDGLLDQYGLPGVRTESRPRPVPDPDFKPEFAKYDVVISNFGNEAAPWPEETRAGLTRFVRQGGGFVAVHAANNSFGDWGDYNRMIGLGGWGDRTAASGVYVYVDESGKTVRSNAAGAAGNHGAQHAFQVIVREPDHPIVRGMPRAWLHARDELYDQLRGPAEEMRVLATAYASPEQGGTGRHEPMIMTVKFGEGRIFHTPMGHADYSMECVGFIVTFQRGTEWAATGSVSRGEIPDDFPGRDQVSQRRFATR